MTGEPYAIVANHGAELLDNSRTLKVVVNQVTIATEPMERDVYISRYFVREGDGWVMGIDVAAYPSLRDFVSALNEIPEFSKAIKQLEEDGDLE